MVGLAQVAQALVAQAVWTIVMLFLLGWWQPEFITQELPLEEPRVKEGALIPLFANKVIPCVRCEKNYHVLPFCPSGDPVPGTRKSLQEIISGDCFTRTQYELKFKVGTVGNILCQQTLTESDVAKFKEAVSDHSQYQMKFNNILFPTDVGFVNPRHGYYLFKHIDFTVQYYGDEVVDIKSVSDLYSAVNITEEAVIAVEFTYSVFWEHSKSKPTKSISQNMAAMKIEWWNLKEKDTLGNVLFKPLIFWVLNLLVVLMVKNLTHRIRFPSVPDTRVEGLLFPAYRSLLSAILGVGTQNLTMICFLFTFGFPDIFYELDLCARTSLLLAYILLFSYYGYDLGESHALNILSGEESWGDCFQPIGIPQFFVIVLPSILLVGQMVKFAFGSGQMLTTTIIVLIGVATLFSWSKGGGIAYSCQYRLQRIGRRSVPVIPPRQSMLMSTPAQMFLGGLLPFLVIFAKMDEVYASLLSLKVCGVFITLFTYFFIVILNTMLVAVICTSLDLRKGEFAWWWRSVLRGGSTAIFIFAYGIYFYCRVNQEIFANLYMFLVYNISLCSVFFVVLGATGFHTSSLLLYGYGYGAEKHN